MNVTVDAWVTYEGNDQYEEGEEPGNRSILGSRQNNTEYEANYTLDTTYVGDNSSLYRLYHKPFYASTEYLDGNYTAWMQMNYTCGDGPQKNMTKWDNFIIMPAEGESGGVNTTGNQTAPPVPEDINKTGDENATIDQNNGSRQSDATRPEQSDSRNESAQPQQGDAQSPGTTPQPVPEPEPEPEPDPVPRLELDIEPVRDTYKANQTQFAPIELEVENVGEEAINGITIDPLISEVRPEWQVRSVSIANLSVNETVTREVFVRPPDTADPGLYVSPVVAIVDGERADVDYFTIDVQKNDFKSSMQIIEAPRSVSLPVNETRNLPVLIENTGEQELSNITGRFQNLEDCGISDISRIGSLAVNESGSLGVSVSTSESIGNCNTTLIVSSDQGAYSFTNVEFSITPEQGLIPRKHRVPFIAIVWTVVLAGYAVVKKRYDLHSSVVKLPLILLMMGEAVIILYLLANYYGLISVSFLPF